MFTALNMPAAEFDAAEQSFVQNIRDHGWVRTTAIAEEGKPGFSFSTGFTKTTKGSELIIFSMDGDVAHDIFWSQYRRAEKGQAPSIGRRAEGVLSNLDVCFFPVAMRYFRDYLGWSRWFYRSDEFPCLQIVWPDPANLFPREPGFDPEFAPDQIDLTEHGWTGHLAP
ncbi:DUF4262 domain-containing protein [Methylobacterium iners]|uniref:DUF4262 domain-containing protein n=1 Tax=Methylobacterium iners TaxID=418707 RepID=UPI001EE1F6C7|nr:DUF4262 domain-containing protein [Methylobacterium iners]